MAKLEIGSGMDQFVADIENLAKGTTGLFKMSVYAGADIVADAVRESIDGLTEGPGLDADQIAGLREGLGIHTIVSENDAVRTSVGFNGYNNHKTKAYPTGQPNSMIARSLEKGTSFSPRNRFVTRAAKAAQSKAEEAMKEVFEDNFKLDHE